MSYDLYFDAGPETRLNKKSFAAHFKDRANYKVSKTQAVYENEDTAVHFIWDAPEDEMCAFNLNFFRPHVFGLEAALELEAFTQAFGVAVTDPQADEAAEPALFDKEKFLRAWNDGNQFAYKAMLEEQTEPVYTWPSARIRDVWEWNFGRPSEAETDAQNIFVPGIFAVAVDGQALSVAVWPPECPILLPEVDFLLVPVTQESEDTALVEWQEVAPVATPYREKAAGLARFRLQFEDWPEPIATFLNKKRSPVGQLNGIGLDEVLDHEMVEKALSK